MTPEADLAADTALTRAAVDAVDVSGQFDEAMGLGEHLRDALWRVQSANLAPRDTPGGLVVAGVGGSAIGGMLARAVLGEHAVRPLALARGYGLPGWTTPDTTVLCVSYSGADEEALAAYHAARALGTATVTLTTGGELAELARGDGVPVIPLPGGFKPRAAVGYMLVVALEVARLCGAGESFHAEVDVAAEHALELAAAWGPDAPEDSAAKALARELHGTIPQLTGAGLTGPVAQRWKSQINENAKLPAFASELPEANHNELAGWEGASALGRFSAVFLDDRELHPRVRQRLELTRGLIAGRGGRTFRVESVGETRLERLISLVLLGDLVSLYLAVLRGVDPAASEITDALASALNGG